MNDVLLFLMTAAADHSWMSRQSALTAAVTSDEFGAAHVCCANTNKGTWLSPHSSSVVSLEPFTCSTNTVSCSEAQGTVQLVEYIPIP